MRAQLKAQLIKQAKPRFDSLWAEAWHQRKIRLPSVCVVEDRIIPAGTSPVADRPIKYTHDLFPHCVEPMDAAVDPAVRKIVLMMGIRDGKTNGVCLSIICQTVLDDPGNIYSVHPTDDDAARFAEGDLEPVIEACLQKAHFVEKKSRDAGRTKEFKKYRGGWIRILSAGSKTKFRGTSVKRVFLHELDALDASSIHKAINRTKGFGNAVIVEESTPTKASKAKQDGGIEYGSHIHQAYDEGDKRKWFVPCRECSKLFVIRFENLKCAADGDGLKIDDKRLETAAVECPRCGTLHNQKQYEHMQALGRWYPTAGLTEAQELDIRANYYLAKAVDPTVRSYWRNGFNSLLPWNGAYASKLHEYMAEEAMSHVSTDARETWVNEIAVELWDDDGETTPAPPARPIINNREDYAPAVGEPVVPMKAGKITCFTDLHANRLEINWMAWAKDEENWGLGHFVLDGDTNRREVWEDWIKHLQRPWKHESGLEMKLNAAWVDGGWRSDPIMAVLRRLKQSPVVGVTGLVRASKGVGKAGAAVIANDYGTISNNLQGTHIGTWAAKELIYERLAWHGAEEKPKAGFFHFGKCYSEEFIRQCVSENPIKKIINAREVLTFKNPEGNRNEGLDMLVGNLAAFRRKRWDFSTWERMVAEHMVAAQKGEKAPPITRLPRMRRAVGALF